ncbi:MAG TPA: response regulator transcription factor [Anaerolineae bacterium]|nr:response regulator transcription factor [Anaerolineae bacterium]
MKPLRILLVDDHVLFRKGIASLISSRSDLTVVGEAEDGIQAVRVAHETLPDIMLMDIHMPNQDGLETLKIIREELPDTHVIMLTVSDDDDDLFAAIRSGAKGYLLKNLDPYELYNMLEKVRDGEAAISGAMAAKILQEFRQPESVKEQAGEVDALTDREIEVLEEVVTGATNKEIAERLHITENTVKIHLRNILEKLQVDNRIQAAIHAVKQGLVKE